MQVRRPHEAPHSGRGIDVQACGNVPITLHALSLASFILDLGIPHAGLQLPEGVCARMGNHGLPVPCMQDDDLYLLSLAAFGGSREHRSLLTCTFLLRCRVNDPSLKNKTLR